jgi:hypothetical protein
VSADVDGSAPSQSHIQHRPSHFDGIVNQPVGAPFMGALSRTATVPTSGAATHGRSTAGWIDTDFALGRLPCPQSRILECVRASGAGGEWR